MSAPMLDPGWHDFVEAIAHRVVELMEERNDARDPVEPRSAAGPLGSGLVDAATLAQHLGVATRYLYAHADELGVARLGAGPKARLRFDLEAAKTAMARSAGERSQADIASADGRSEPARARPPRRLPNHLPKTGHVLQIRRAP